MRIALILAMLSALFGCIGMPKSIKPVDNFKLNKYLGTWYEIARLDHSFEHGLTNVTANYSLRGDGGVRVINRGFNADEQIWEQAEGKAYFVDSTDQGYLKVSFFGPFYGSYVVFELEPVNYDYAFVSGPNLDYLWLLARSPEVSQTVKDKFEQMSKERGFDVSELIYVDHGVEPDVDVQSHVEHK
ncbi:lipocalin family protein [Thalassotalea maritima]|uniref:lipocalin family protein n=1 Tax=Thalassotalea maritima TaxID=3242416 RepID=UPI00352812A5